jgi:hypothetical protein
MYQVSGPPCPIMTLKSSPSAQYGQRTVLDGLRAAFVIAFGPLARLRSFLSKGGAAVRGTFVRLRICDCLLPCYCLIRRRKFTFRAAPVASIDESSIACLSETEHDVLPLGRGMMNPVCNGVLDLGMAPMFGART